MKWLKQLFFRRRRYDDLDQRLQWLVDSCPIVSYPKALASHFGVLD